LVTINGLFAGKIKIFLHKLYNVYLWIFARPYFQKFNQVIFRIVIGPLGFMNFSEDFRLTGERRLIQKLSVLNLKTFIDIGANKGQWAKMILEETNESRIYAFEPQKSAFENLVKLSNNSSDRLFPYNLALGNIEGDVKINVHDTSSELSYIDDKLNKLPLLSGKSNTTEIIKITKLDTHIENNKGIFSAIDFIKIDTEGFEYDVLLGSKNTIMKYKPKFVQIEMNWHALFRNNSLLMISTELQEYRCFQILPFGSLLYEVDPRSPIRNFYQLSNFLFIHKYVNLQNSIIA